ncbi:MAG TPA: S9 family peptidase [Polyangia bacterium]|nr:S9 family peptidase [Polyangia bacterium]
MMTSTLFLLALRGLTLGDQFQVTRIGALAVSPDGKTLVYEASTLDREANSRHVDLWALATAGGTPRRLTSAGKLNEHPSFAPDSQRIAYASDRDGTPQIWIHDLARATDTRLTQLALGASGPVVSADGKWIAFTSEMFIGCKDEACNHARVEAAKTAKVKAREFDQLYVRHWMEWKDKRMHLFVMPAAGGPPRDLTPGGEDAPTWRLHEPDDYGFTADSSALVFATKAARGEAWSTNSDLWEVKVTGGAARRLTQNPGDDASPRVAPDGKLVAYRAQARAGYESDRWRLQVLDRTQKRAPREVATGFDRWVGELGWAPDGRTLYLAAEDRGRSVLWAVAPSGGEPRALSGGELSVDGFVAAGGGVVYFAGSASDRPPEIYRAQSSGSAAPQQLTHLGDALKHAVELRRVEPLETTGADGAPIHGFLLKPTGFRPGVRYPTLLLVHGGPQGAWLDDWGSIRWSPQLYAARGYVVVLGNPRGSTGWGQAYTEAVSRDWGGKPLDDLLRLVDAAAKLPYVDGHRMCALGASYGGYMINWMQGHTDRFRCLVSHAGPFDQWSMYFQTEELWFPEWEMGGTPWQTGAAYDKWSPSHHVERFKTPQLVTHGELDFRVPVGEALGMFTALQRRGVASKLLLFPDEGHFVSKPQNVERWLGTIWTWLDQHLKPR